MGSGPRRSLTDERCAPGGSSPLESRAYFEAVYDAARQAARGAGGFTDYFLQIAGHSVRLRFAGPALIPLTIPALAHLVTEPTPSPGLTICLCDSASTGTERPPIPWDTADQTYRGGVPGYSDGRFRASYHGWAQVLNMLDGELGLAVFWVADADRLHFSMRGAPLRDILHWWLGDHGSQLVHGAGVGTGNAGVLLTGVGSSGKSTTAMVCLDAGLLYAGDDHVAVSSEPIPFLHSLYNTAHLDHDGRYTFGDLVRGIEDPKPSDDVKLAVFVQRHWPDRVVRGFTLRAIVLPRVTGQLDTRLRAVSAVEALVALAPATILALPGAGQDVLHQMANLARKIPSYVLELGTDLSQIPPAVLSLF